MREVATVLEIYILKEFTSNSVNIFLVFTGKVLSELRRLEPLHHDINCQIVKIWYRFENLSM